MKRVIVVIALLFAVSVAGYAQQKQNELITEVKSTPAYRILVEKSSLAETKLKLSEHAGKYAEARIWQFEFEALEGEMQRLALMSESNLPKLTETYGLLVSRRAKLIAERREILLSYAAGHPQLRLNEIELNLIEHDIALGLR